MSTITTVEIECPCGEFIVGSSRGDNRAAARTALNEATDKLIDHAQGIDFTVLDFGRPDDRRQIVTSVINITAQMS